MIKLSFPHPKESLYELLNLNGPAVSEKMFEKYLQMDARLTGLLLAHP